MVSIARQSVNAELRTTNFGITLQARMHKYKCVDNRKLHREKISY